MCLIIVKKVGTKLNNELLAKAIKKSGIHNNHGYGFTIKRGTSKNINISKGQKTVTELISDIEESKIGLNDELIVHLRFGTAGDKNAINCHPFVVSNDTEDVETVYSEFVRKPVLAHNGVISEFTDRQSKYSDTFHFVRDYLSIIDPKYHQTLLDNLGSNKFAMSYPGKKPILLGGTWLQEGGLYFSNAGYKDYTSYSSSNPTGAGTNYSRGTCYHGDECWD